MKNKIRVLIVSNSEIDTSKIKTNYPNWLQNEFEFLILKDDIEIQRHLKEFNPDVIMTSQKDNMMYPNLSQMRFEERKKWIHPDDFYHSDFILNCFMGSLNDHRQPLFSIITPSYNTEIYQIHRAYESLKNQTYDNWEWVILNVGDKEETKNELLRIANEDIRVRLFESYDNKSSIGNNKKILAGMSLGEYIVEMDHDDELTNDALSLVKQSFDQYPNVGFVYSDCCERFEDGTFVDYPEGWGFGYGSKYWQEYNGQNYLVMGTPNINPKTIRYITASPNHVRVWKKDIYNKIGGHNERMFIADDYELMVRTFLNTIMLKIPKMLYIQHYKDTNTAQRARNQEIQRLVSLTSSKYDIEIRNRFEELMINDFVINNGYTDMSISNPEVEQHANIIIKL